MNLISKWFESVFFSRHHLSDDDCLEDKRESYQNCSVLCSTVVNNDTHTHTHTYEQFLKMSVGLGLCLVLCICLGLTFCASYRFSLAFILVLFAFVMFNLVFLYCAKRLSRKDVSKMT